MKSQEKSFNTPFGTLDASISISPTPNFDQIFQDTCMKLYPESAPHQLEFDKVKALLMEKCRSDYAKTRASDLRIHTRKEFIERELKQTHEFRQLLLHAYYFPNEYVLNLSRELRLLSIEGALLSGEELVSLRKLARG